MDDEQRKARDLNRAISLFRFLARAKQLSSKTVFDVAKYKDNGEVIWLHKVPIHDAVSLQSQEVDGLKDPSGALLKVERVARPLPPKPGDELSVWLDGPYDDYVREPGLRDEILAEIDLDEFVDDGLTPDIPLRLLAQEPDIQNLFLDWLGLWLEWAKEVASLWEVTQLYSELFEIRNQVSSGSFEYELVIGFGLLEWVPSGHTAIRRHLLTCPAEITADGETGSLTLTADLEGGLSYEDEMVPPDAIKDMSRLNEIRSSLRDYEGGLSAEGGIEEVLKPLTYLLDASATYRNVMAPPASFGSCSVSWAPAIILRKRTERGIIRTLQSVADQLEEAGDIPEGLYPLVDLDRVPDAGQQWTESDGAVHEVDGTVFLPMPVNKQQLEVIRRVDRNAQTIVQGPPGTGKTHTAAALISHLLSLGKRVLVTAQTDQALIEVRDKLPSEIQNLAVSVIGSSRDDLAQLEMAARGLTGRLATHDPAAAREDEARLLADLDRFARERASLRRKMLSYRELEVSDHSYRGKSGTLGGLADELVASEEEHGWLSEYSVTVGGTASPVSSSELVRLLSHLSDEVFQSDRDESLGPLIGTELLPSIEGYRSLVGAERVAQGRVSSLSVNAGALEAIALNGMSDAERERIVQALRGLAAAIERYGDHPFPWVSDMVDELCLGLVSPWNSRYRTLNELAQASNDCLDRLGAAIRVTCEGDSSHFVSYAKAVLVHLRSGKSIKVKADGVPRTSHFSARALKESGPLFENVRVNGVPPTTEDDLLTFLNWDDALRVLTDLDRAWPASMVIPDEDTFRERLDWHESQIEVLHGLIALAGEFGKVMETFERNGLGLPDWTDTSVILRLADRFDLVGAEMSLADTTKQISAIEDSLRPYLERAEKPTWAVGILEAVVSRNMTMFRASYERVEHLHEIANASRFVDEVQVKINGISPGLCDQISESPGDRTLAGRLNDFEDAWGWSQMANWLRDQDPADSNRVSRELDAVEERIRITVEELSALRAWSHAVAPDRMTGKAQGHLKSYAQQVRKFGKTGGKYKVRRSAQIRNTLHLCRPSVPVWIMPLYRVVDQIATEPNAFDVVIVDEASQAGLEAIFLQYLAPKIVVIGDDKQVSPSNVGLHQGLLRDLADQYIGDDEFIGNWAEATRSLFDEAQMRYGGTVTLIEHRRCVPEIIEFCNAIAYEPAGIRLQAVRQLGHNRLPPIVPVYLEDGYREGNSKANPVEVEAVVEAVLGCCGDPKYDGMTFGIISLLGNVQSKLIQSELMQRLPPEEWAARDLRCGEPPAFQGSERDVIFLSMVAAPSADRRLAALTRESFMQRYNVAVSRAKNQLWLFHSINLKDVPNSEDLRHRLIEYCHRVANDFGQNGESYESTLPVPDNERVSPFDSLFEQRVFNRLVSKGYTVVPQMKSQGYQIDLVVQGGAGSLAVECDGDHWHGPAEYGKDLSRQRDLERMGWVFHHIRLSKFNLDPAAEIAELRKVLDGRGIYPRGWDTSDEVENQQPSTDDEVVRFEVEEAVALEDLNSGLRVVDLVGEEVEPLEPGREDALSPTNSGVVSEVLTSADEVQEVLLRGEWRATLKSKEAPVPTSSFDRAPQSVSPATLVGQLEPYVEWQSSRIDDPISISRNELAKHLVAVTEIEGPILCHRLFQVLNNAAGNNKLGKNIRSAMNKALYHAEQAGDLVIDRPLGETGYLQTTVRLPEQHLLKVRQIGPRPLDHVPPAEVAEVLILARSASGNGSEEAVFRELLHFYGKSRLTSNVIDRLRACARLSTK